METGNEWRQEVNGERGSTVRDRISKLARKHYHPKTMIWDIALIDRIARFCDGGAHGNYATDKGC